MSSISVLPIKLLSFTGQTINRNVTLLWQATEEINSGYYNVQRSVNGVEFETIGRRTVMNGRTISSYEFTDINALDIKAKSLFYRLEILGKDNGKTYSNIIKVSFNRSNLFVTINPNLVSSTLHFSVNNTREELGMVIITDVKGIIVKKENINLVKGSISKVMNVSGLNEGSYVLTTVASSGKAHAKFLKL